MYNPQLGNVNWFAGPGFKTLMYTVNSQPAGQIAPSHQLEEKNFQNHVRKEGDMRHGVL